MYSSTIKDKYYQKNPQKFHGRAKYYVFWSLQVGGS